MSARVPIASIAINGRETLRVCLLEFRSVQHCGIRRYDSAGFPSRDGVDLPVEHLLALQAAIDAAVLKAGELGLLPKPHKKPAKTRTTRTSAPRSP